MELNRDLIIPLCFYHDVQVCAGRSWIVEYIKATIDAKLRRSIPFLGGSAWRNVYLPAPRSSILLPETDRFLDRPSSEIFCHSEMLGCVSSIYYLLLR